MNKKYELLPKGSNGLHQIRALRDFGIIKAGELGGYIAGEGNLSHYDNAWVFGNAQVLDNARVLDNAWVFGDARVFGNAQVLGDARVFGNAQVLGRALVSGNAQVCEICTKAPVQIDGLYYSITITDNHLKAGCQLHQIQDWLIKTDRELIEMDGKQAVKFYHETLKPLMMALNLK